MTDTSTATYRPVTIGLGSNVGDREQHLLFALSALNAHLNIRLMKMSSLYNTAAHALASTDEQDDYLNAACLIETNLAPRALLDVCLQVESQRGRDRTQAARWDPRTLDIDILTYDGMSVETPDLRIPHPGIAYRRFVLIPLFEIAPDLQIPSPINRTVQYLLDHCQDDSPVTVFREKKSETWME